MNNSLDVEIGRRLRSLRRAARLEKEAVAARIHINVRDLELYESGALKTPSRTLLKFASLYNVHFSHFFDELAKDGSDLFLGTDPCALDDN